MFIKAPLFYFTLIMSFLGGFLYYSLNYYTPYRASIPQAPKLQRPVFHQKRSFVTKDFYVCDGVRRYHHRLTSPSSVLHYDPNDAENPLIETLENVEGLFQDGLGHNNKSQQIHSIWAPTATYHYKSRQFHGSEVFLSLFSLQGHRLPDRLDQVSPFLEGKASHVSCVFDNTGSKLKSSHFKAKVNTDYREPL